MLSSIQIHSDIIGTPPHPPQCLSFIIKLEKRYIFPSTLTFIFVLSFGGPAYSCLPSTYFNFITFPSILYHLQFYNEKSVNLQKYQECRREGHVELKVSPSINLIL
jgi:hypothetical protein